jgi:hypothetical protein
MKILENIKERKVSRKNFIFYSGIVFSGVFMLIKMPFKFFGKKEEERLPENDSKKIRFEINPEAVKRG